MPSSQLSPVDRLGRMYRFGRHAWWSTVILYYELILYFSTGGTFFKGSFPVLVLLAIGTGCVLSLLTTLFCRPVVNRILTIAALVFFIFIFEFSFCIYMEFQIHYEPLTNLAGFGDVLKGFTGEITSAIFSFRGLSRLILFALPLILYLIFGFRDQDAGPATKKSRLRLIGIWFLCTLLSSVLLMVQPTYRLICTEEYAYSTAVSTFGLLPGLRLDFFHHLFPSDESFEKIDPDTLSTSSQTITTEETLPTTTESFTTSATEEITSTTDEVPSSESTTLSTTEETQTTSETTNQHTTKTTGQTSQTAKSSATTEKTGTPVSFSEEYSQLDYDFTDLLNSSDSEVKQLTQYITSLEASRKNEYTGLFKGKNLIVITAEAFCAEAIDETLTPTLYRLANQGIQFTDYYQQASAGTTGGEYQILFGLLPTRGGQSFKQTADHTNYFTLGSQLNRLGYNGWAFHNHTYTYYSRNLTHNNLGYSHGFMGMGNGMEKYVKNLWPESDYEMFKNTVPMYILSQPFNVYYMTVSGHGSYDYATNAMVRKHWSEVKNLSQYTDPVKGYYACTLDLEAGLASLVEQLEAANIADETVIVLTSDHFPYGLDNDAGLGNMPYLSELYGYNVKTPFQRDHNRLIIWSGCLEDNDPIVVNSPISSLDILPTLSNLFGTEWDSRLFPGRDVFSDAMPLVFNITYDWKTELGTYDATTKTFTPVSSDVTIPDGYVDSIRTIVRNKINLCKLMLSTDYFSYLYPEG